ncbi:MAG: histidine kinase [Roseivirga sp.]
MKRKTLLWHIVFWTVYMAIFTFVEGGYQNNFDEAFALEASYLPSRLLLVYFNYFILLPRFLLKRKIERYIGYTFITIIIATTIQRVLGFYVINPLIFPDWEQGAFFQAYRIAQAGMIITSPMIFLIGMTVVIRWAGSEKKMQQLAREKVETELKYLRNQVNPHFFFNTLNNLYGLAQEKSDKTPEVVLRLSELMSYMLYETNKPLIQLGREIDYIRNYISLEEQRYEDRFNCNLSIKGEVNKVKVPPVLMLPFVENAFKHGINKESEGAWMNIDLRVEGEKLYFVVENSLAAQEKSDAEKGGLGIKNVERRLELLYPDGHTLKYGPASDKYRIELMIDLTKLSQPGDDF